MCRATTAGRSSARTGRRSAGGASTRKGDRAEIWTMNADGSDQRQITQARRHVVGAVFPSDRRISDLHDQQAGVRQLRAVSGGGPGKREPVRVTYTAGFDGLPVFSPDGKKLSWTSSRTGGQGLADFHRGLGSRRRPQGARPGPATCKPASRTCTTRTGGAGRANSHRRSARRT